MGSPESAAKPAASDDAAREGKTVATATVDYRCAQCGAPVTAEPGADSLTCGHCGHRQPIERREGMVVEYDFEHARKHAPRGSASDLAKGAREVECKGCGARTVLAGQSTACPFCGSPLVADLPTSEAAILPESLLPHKITREQARLSFQVWLKTRWFAPSDLVKRAKTSGLDGVFLPYWTYDSRTTTPYIGMRGDYYYVTVSYTDSKGNSQTRTERRTRWSSASGTVYVAFDDVLVCASKSLPGNLVEELEPWDLPSLQPFEPAYLAGFVTERYQVDLEQGFAAADARMRPKIKSAIRSDIGGDEQQILSMDVNHHDVKFKHLLLPLWISSFRYGERVFRIMVNARTGEVQGERPWSVIKILLFSLFILGLIAGGFYLYSRAKSGGDDAESTPTPSEPYDVPTPVDQVPLEPPIPPPTPATPRPVIEPLDALPAATAKAKAALRDAALVSLTIAQVDDDGTARGEATFAYRALTPRRGRPCTGSVSLDEQGSRWELDGATDCTERLVLAPSCSLAEVMARAKAQTPPPSTDLGLAGVNIVTYQAAAEVEAPEPGSRAAGRAAPGAWTVLRGLAQVTIADDCAPPARRPLRRR